MYIYIYILIIINTYKDILIHICVHMCMFFVVFSSFFWCCCLLLFPLFPHFPLLSIKKTKMRSLQNLGLRDLDARFIFPVEPIWSFYSHWLKVDRFFKPCRFLEAFLQWRSGPAQFTSELLWRKIYTCFDSLTLTQNYFELFFTMVHPKWGMFPSWCESNFAPDCFFQESDNPYIVESKYRTWIS